MLRLINYKIFYATNALINTISAFVAIVFSYIASSSISWYRMFRSSQNPVGILVLPVTCLPDKQLLFFSIQRPRLQLLFKYFRSFRTPIRGAGGLFVFLALWFNSFSQRQDISLNNNWLTSINNKDLSPGQTSWKKINVPHNWDDYYGYRRLIHGNLHADAVYKKNFSIKQSKQGKKIFLFFEGVGSYATVFLNTQKVGEHNGGRTTFTIDVTNIIKADGTKNELLVKASHPANIKGLPWVCGGCSDERGFSEGSQPMGIFRPVHLIITNDVRIEPFGVHAWADIQAEQPMLNITATIKNYSGQIKKIVIEHKLIDAVGNEISKVIQQNLQIKNGETTIQKSKIQTLNSKIKLWSVENPYLYKIVSLVKENNIVIDKLVTDFGFRTINWKNPTNQFVLNGKPVFINGTAEYEHLFGQSHAFSNEQIIARMKWIRAAGFNAFRDGHQPHNLLYGKLCNEKGILWWTQLSAHVWYDTKEFRENFKQLLKEWVIERRNDPSVILWGLQNESKLPKDFAEECTELIRSLDPTASTQRLITTCNGGEGTDWDVPQNWTGTYGGNPTTYGEDLKKQILVGEYGAWRTIDLHSEGGFVQNGILSEDRMTQLMEQKIRLAESVKDSSAGHFFWLLTSHDNPGRVQGGEGVRELDRIGPVNYKGLLTPWEEPTDAFYMFRSNYADKHKEPMVYIVSHTWPNRWMTPGIKDSIIVYSNCDEVELFNDLNGSSLGRKKKNGIGTHFQWDSVNIRYNVLSAVGYVDGKIASTDIIVLNHLPQSPNFKDFADRYSSLLSPQKGYNYFFRINCGGPAYKDENGNNWQTDKGFANSWTKDFPGIPENFASQRRTFSPIKGTMDWKLFQTFRYGKEKLKFEFDVPDGEYFVELYFIEPWLGIGGGMKASGMRLFDVAINGKTVLDDLDIWTEAGTNTALKKILKAKSVNGKLIISFPESKVGQALISAIAIASSNKKIGPASKSSLIDIKRCNGCVLRSWLDIGDKVYQHSTISFNALPSNLYGADWLQINQKQIDEPVSFMVNEDVDVFIGYKKTKNIFEGSKMLENTKTEIVTDENGGTVYEIFKQRYKRHSEVMLNVNEQNIIALVPVNNMQPAYDLKPIVQYKTNVVKLTEGVNQDSANGRYCSVVKTNNKVSIEYPIQIGAADIYSITMKYFYGKAQSIKGKLQLIGPGNTMMLEDEVSFTFTRDGKWNQFAINTGTQINAGNYIVRLVIKNANGLAISGIDVQ
ncbi:MAG: malectin domain-containing carbohydrate-binding protein [Chitinophagaceae bacterium]